MPHRLPEKQAEQTSAVKAEEYAQAMQLASDVAKVRRLLPIGYRTVNGYSTRAAVTAYPRATAVNAYVCHNGLC